MVKDCWTLQAVTYRRNEWKYLRNGAVQRRLLQTTNNLCLLAILQVNLASSVSLDIPSSTSSSMEPLGINGTGFSYGSDVLPVTQPTASKHWRKHKAITSTSGLTTFFLHPPLCVARFKLPFWRQYQYYRPLIGSDIWPIKQCYCQWAWMTFMDVSYSLSLKISIYLWSSYNLAPTARLCHFRLILYTKGVINCWLCWMPNFIDNT